MSEYSNFRVIKYKQTQLGKTDILASVDETTHTGFLWWMKQHSKSREVCSQFGSLWFFADNGHEAPFDMVGLFRAWEANQEAA